MYFNINPRHLSLLKLGKSKNVMNALYKGFVVSAVSSLVILYPVTDYVIGFTSEYTVNGKTFNGMNLYYMWNNWFRLLLVY